MRDFSTPGAGVSEAAHWRLVLETSQVGVWELDVTTGQAWRNLRHDQIFGYDALQPEWSYGSFLAHVLAEDRARVQACYGNAVAEGREWSFECRIRRCDGDIRWISASGRPMRSPQGEVQGLIGHVLDITGTKREEEHLRLVTAELNHRVRNMVTMLRALVQVSADGASDVAKFAEAVQQRLTALARTQDMLGGSSDAAILLADVIDAELQACGPAAGRVQLHLADGLTLSRTTAQRFALVLHELVTNAVKYGALAGGGGRVVVTSDAVSESRVRLEWRECCAEPVQMPSRRGFGSLLMERAMGDQGEVTPQFAADGLVAAIELNTRHPEAAVATEPRIRRERRPVAAAGEVNLSGVRILVVEDEPLITLGYEAAFKRLGMSVVGPCDSCRQALALLDGAAPVPDVAMLDLNLGDQTSDEVAQWLMARDVPIFFTTGYGDDSGVSARYPNMLFLTKPASTEQLASAVRQLLVAKRHPEPVT